MNLPDVSVIVPVRNRPHAALVSVRSALAQTHANLEVIAIDDASSDDTAEALEAIRDDRLRVLRHSVNRGGATARNTGIDAARAPIVAFLDSDDWWMPRKIELSLAVAAGLGGEWVLFDQQEVQTRHGVRRTSYPSGLLTKRIPEALFIDRMPMQTSSVMLPTDVARAVRFCDGLPRLQDWDFYLRLAQRPVQVVVQPDVLTGRDIRAEARISSKLDPDYLLRWLAERRHMLTRREVFGFLGYKVAPEAVLCGRRPLGAACLLAGLASGVVDRRTAAIETLRLVTTRRAFDAFLSWRT